MPATKIPDQEDLSRARDFGNEDYQRKIPQHFERKRPPGSSQPDTHNFALPSDDSDDPAEGNSNDIANEIWNRENNPDNPSASNDEAPATQESRGVASRPDVYHKTNVQPQKSGGRFHGLKRKRNALLVTATLFGATTGIIGLIVAPAGYLIHLKEVYVKKVGDRLQSLQQVRTNRIVNKMLVSDPLTAGCTVKVKCRYKGMTQRQIDKFQRRNPGVQIRTDGRTVSGRHKIISISYIDENGRPQTIFAKDFKRAAQNSLAFQKLIINFNKSKVALWRDKAAGKVFTKLKIGLSKVRAPRGPPQTEEQARQQRQQRLAERDAARLARANKYRGAIKTSNIISTICAIKGIITAATVAVKVTQAADEAKLAMELVGKPADTIKSGLADGDSEVSNAINNAATRLNEQNDDGKTMSDSYGYQYASRGVLIKDKGNQPDYQLGIDSEKNLLGRITAATNGTPGLSQVSGTVNKVLNDEVCLGAGIISTAFCIATIGWGCAASTAAMLVLVNRALPIITKYISKTPDLKSAVGADAGDAVTGGFSYTAKTNAQYRGAYPLTKNQAVRYDTFSDNAQNGGNWESTKTAWDFGDPSSFAGKLASAFLPSMARMSTSPSSIPATLASLPSISLSQASTNAQAESVIKDEYEQCNDAEYKALDLATDPFCVPQYGFNPSLMLGDTDYNKPTAALDEGEQPKEQGGFSLAWLFETPTAHAATNDTRGFMPDNRFDADLVVDFMHDSARPWIDDDGEASSYDDIDDDYVDYTEQCLETTDPLEPTSPDMCKPKQCTTASTGSNEFRYCMYSVYASDTSIDDQLEDRDASGAAADNSDSETESESVTGSIPTGAAQDLAQQIVDSGKVTGDGSYYTQISNIAQGNPGCYISPKILGFILAMSKKYKLHISSLNRRCTGVLTASGTGSLHYSGQGGKAVDVSIINTVILGPNMTGAAKEIAENYFNDAAKILPKNAEMGQIKSCGLDVDTNGISDIVPDACNHAHIGIP